MRVTIIDWADVQRHLLRISWIGGWALAVTLAIISLRSGGPTPLHLDLGPLGRGWARSPDSMLILSLAALMILVLLVHFIGMAVWRAAPSLLDRQPKATGNLVDAVVGDADDAEEEDSEGATEADREGPAEEEPAADAA